MKVSEMQEGKLYKCVWQDCAYIGWSKAKILLLYPCMIDLDIWEEDK